MYCGWGRLREVLSIANLRMPAYGESIILVNALELPDVIVAVMLAILLRCSLPLSWLHAAAGWA